MANNEIHNYVDEQITPNDTDYLDLDADQGGGNFLSKKLTFANLRKWLFKLVSQEVEEITVTFGDLQPSGNYNTTIFNANDPTSSEVKIPTATPYNNGATFIYHIHNGNGSAITLNATYETTADNPDITTTSGGYAQVWVTYHKKADLTEYWTANTINFI